MNMSFDIDEQPLIDLTKSHFATFAEQHNLKQCECHVIVGDVRSSIIEYAESLGCDLIVVGSHGRRGLARLLGSTANAVIHHAQCDVLAVRAEK